MFRIFQKESLMIFLHGITIQHGIFNPRIVEFEHKIILFELSQPLPTPVTKVKTDFQKDLIQWRGWVVVGESPTGVHFKQMSFGTIAVCDLLTSSSSCFILHNFSSTNPIGPFKYGSRNNVNFSVIFHHPNGAELLPEYPIMSFLSRNLLPWMLILRRSDRGIWPKPPPSNPQNPPLIHASDASLKMGKEAKINTPISEPT